MDLFVNSLHDYTEKKNLDLWIFILFTKMSLTPPTHCVIAVSVLTSATCHTCCNSVGVKTWRGEEKPTNFKHW